MKPLKVLSKFENYFLIRTVSFQVHLEAGGYFLLRRFLRLHLQQAGIQHKNTLVPHLNGRWISKFLVEKSFPKNRRWFIQYCTKAEVSLPKKSSNFMVCSIQSIFQEAEAFLPVSSWLWYAFYKPSSNLENQMTVCMGYPAMTLTRRAGKRRREGTGKPCRENGTPNLRSRWYAKPELIVPILPWNSLHIF